MAEHAAAGPRGASGLTLTLCGRLVPRVASSKAAVTCKICLRRLAENATAPSPLILERGTKYDPRYDDIAYASVPGRIEHAFRWPSVERALKDYAITLHDGFSSKSVTSGLTQYARLGAQVQGGARLTPRAMCQAEDAASVEKALAWACGHREKPETRVQRVIVLARVVGINRGRIRRTRQGLAVDGWAPVPAVSLAAELGIDEVLVGAVVRECKRWLRVDMHARGLTPPPHAAKEREDAEARKRELLRA